MSFKQYAKTKYKEEGQKGILCKISTYIIVTVRKAQEIAIHDCDSFYCKTRKSSLTIRFCYRRRSLVVLPDRLVLPIKKFYYYWRKEKINRWNNGKIFTLYAYLNILKLKTDILTLLQTQPSVWFFFLWGNKHRQKWICRSLWLLS